tara:strand:- start:342 stop:890 length:549 start_codon:yes stop_codon:yes gene_type:complete
MGSGQELWRSLEPLQSRSSEFLDAVASYLPRVQTLSCNNKRKLSVFKSAELVNALLQIREKRESEDRFGPELASASFVLVRAAIRDRIIDLGCEGTVDLRAPEIRSVINEGCRLFQAGKKRPEQYQLALALSEAQCIALYPWLDESLTSYSKGCGRELPEALIHAVRDNFITPYRQGEDNNF